eukprot:2510150-Rhodomonas_salina.2
MPGSCYLLATRVCGTDVGVLLLVRVRAAPCDADIRRRHGRAAHHRRAHRVLAPSLYRAIHRPVPCYAWCS